MATQELKLSDDQDLAIAKIFEWAEDEDKPNEFVLAGLAGTGKTTIMRTVLDAPQMQGLVSAVVATTGKAALRLRECGMEHASTIHSAFFEFAGARKNEAGDRVLDFNDGDNHFRFVLCDEASMVGARELASMRERCGRILWVGDHGQLPPVSGATGLLDRPDAKLEKIHRQGEGSRILTLAHRVRTGWSPQATKLELADSDDLQLRRMSRASMSVFAAMEIIDHHNSPTRPTVICAFNFQRRKINELVRATLKRPKEKPAVGDPLMCLRTDYKVGIYNGEQVTITAVISDNEWEVIDSVGQSRTIDGEIDIDGSLSSEDRPLGAPVLFDFAYAITAHKAQGSEWPHVIVLDPGDDSKFDLPRWRYTAATRAAKRLTYVTP